MRFDVLAIGDTTIDAFIRLKDARVNCDINDEHCLLSLRFGDKVPYEFVEVVPAVGNSANAAVACARLGVAATLRVHIGDDENGTTCIDAFKKENVDTSLIVRESGKKTNYHYVLWYESERTILIKHEQFSYSFPALGEAPKWIYLSSLGEGTENYHGEIAEYLKKNPEVKLAFQPGTFQIKAGIDKLKDIYSRADVFFCNKQEAQIILKTEEKDIKKLLQGIRDLGVKVAFVTDGRGGSYGMDENGAWHSPMYPDPKPPVERTGAGDATASTTIAYIIQGLDPREAMLRGLVNSAYVVQEIGAQKGLLTKERLEELFAKRPADFKVAAL